MIYITYLPFLLVMLKKGTDITRKLLFLVIILWVATFAFAQMTQITFDSISYAPPVNAPTPLPSMKI